MTLTINGTEREFSKDKLTVQELLAELSLELPVLVEHNGIALFEREFSVQTVDSGDRLELLRMVAGG